ncbi:MAG: putative diguanylate cyclase [Methanomassiliicoccales archaeon PtaU1.Bin124]|nr:MAG: putative diguanylate cyclase [Methanomassiliicoccales archaeon PtaU1.Bin124]
MIRVLYVDDEEDLLDLSKMFLERAIDLKVDVAISASVAKEMMGRANYDAIISDYQMPCTNGIDFLKDLRGRGTYLPFILFTGKGREEVVIEALNSGADFYVQKGGNPVAQFKELEHKVREAVRRYRAEKALQNNEQRLAKAHALGNTGCWEYDWINSPQMIWGSKEGLTMFGLGHLTGEVPLEDIENCIPERIWARQKLHNLIHKGEKYDLVYTIHPADGSPPRIINSIAELEQDANGNPVKVLGLLKDITDQVKAQEAIMRDQLRNQDLFKLAQMSGLTPKDIAKRAMDYFIELTQSEVGYIAFVNEEQTAFTMQHFSHAADMERPKMPDGSVVFNIGDKGLWAEAMRTRKAVITNDYDAPNPMKKGLPEGHIKIARHMCVPVLDGDRIVAIAGVGNKKTDYTEEDAINISLLMDGMWRMVRKIEAEEAMRQSEERYRTYIDMSPLDHYLIGEDGRILECNPQACKTLNLSKQMILSMSAWDLASLIMSTDAKQKVNVGMFTGIMMEALQTGKSPMFDHPRAMDFQLPNGERRNVEMMMFPIKSEKGWRIGIFTRDVTAQTRAEQELKENRFKLTMAMEMAKLVYWEFNIEKDEYTFNDRFYDLYGTNAEKEGGYVISRQHYYRRFIHPDDLDFVRSMEILARGSTPEDFHFEHRIIRADGEVRNITVYPCRVEEDDGDRQKVFGVNQDITELKRIERSLKKANESLNLLTSITRHDISNQLMLQRGYLNLVKEDATGAGMTEKLTRLEESIKTVQRQIEFTRDYEQMGTMAPKWNSINSIVQNLANRKYAKEIKMECDAQNLWVLADPMFDKVIYNVVENSIRYAGIPVTITMRCETGENDLKLIIEDDGQGIPENEKEAIFVKGFGKGTGLGLFLSREILALTGITIKENGSPGKGARFEIVVPSGHYRFN